MFAFYPQEVHKLSSNHCRRPARQARQAHPFDLFFQALVPEHKEVSYDTKINPRVQLSSDPSHYGIEAEIPGFSRDQVDIEFDAKNLKISGSTAKPVEPVAVSTPASASASAAPAIEERGRSQSVSSQARPVTVEDVADESESDSEFVQVDHNGKPKQKLPDNGPVLDVAFPDPEEQAPEEPAAPTTTAAPVHTKSFEYSVELPKDVDRDNVSAELRDGILRIRIGRQAPNLTRRKITIQ